MKKIISVFFIIGSLTIFAAAQTTAFNFQGRLNDGSSPANGKYDLQFKLYDAITGGNQVGATIAKSNLTLINGVFSTPLDFGLTAFDGSDRFIEIGLRQTASGTTTPNAFVILGSRQKILSVPYTIRSLRSTLADDATHAANADNAVYAQNAANATNAVNSTNAINATNATNATNAQTAVNSQQLGGVAASQYIQQGAPGTVKAFAEINGVSPYNVTVCYNSTLTGSAATTPPCGITVNHFAFGGYGLNFGFNIYSRPAIVSVGNFDGQNQAAYIRYLPNNFSTFDVRTYNTGNSTQTTDVYNFTVVIY